MAESETDVPPSVHVDLSDHHVATLTFRNPSRRHALSNRLLSAMENELEQLAARQVPVVLLGSGTGESVWSAGHDIAELAEDRDPLAAGKPLERVLRRIRSYPGVVIAVVSGTVWGGACDLVMSCDMVLADRSAQFAITPANIGLPYSTSGLLRFFNNLPIHILKEMFFCARPIDASLAEQFGVVNRVLADPASLSSTAAEIALAITRKAPLAIRSVKEQLRILEDMQPIPADAMERIAELRRVACESDDMKEGIEAFLQRRPAQFRGK